MTDEQKPLPCPWCKQLPRVIEYYGIACRNEACPVQPRLEGRFKEPEESWIKRWNTRAPVPLQPKVADFVYQEPGFGLDAFKPSALYEAALKKAMDVFLAWRCPKCGATGRMVFRGPEYDSGFFLENANTLPVGSIVCSKGCANE